MSVYWVSNPICSHSLHCCNYLFIPSQVTSSSVNTTAITIQAPCWWPAHCEDSTVRCIRSITSHPGVPSSSAPSQTWHWAIKTRLRQTAESREHPSTQFCPPCLSSPPYIRPCHIWGRTLLSLSVLRSTRPMVRRFHWRHVQVSCLPTVCCVVLVKVASSWFRNVQIGDLSLHHG